jgi:hypothetical protein
MGFPVLPEPDTALRLHGSSDSTRVQNTQERAHAHACTLGDTVDPMKEIERQELVRKLLLDLSAEEAAKSTKAGRGYRAAARALGLGSSTIPDILKGKSAGEDVRAALARHYPEHAAALSRTLAVAREIASSPAEPAPQATKDAIRMMRDRAERSYREAFPAVPRGRVALLFDLLTLARRDSDPWHTIEWWLDESRRVFPAWLKALEARQLQTPEEH